MTKSEFFYFFRDLEFEVWFADEETTTITILLWPFMVIWFAIVGILFVLRFPYILFERTSCWILKRTIFINTKKYPKDYDGYY